MIFFQILVPFVCRIRYTVTTGKGNGPDRKEKGPDMFHYNAIKQQVIDYLGEFASDYDIDGIMDDLRLISRKCDSDITSIDDFDSDEFQRVIACADL